MNSISKLKRAHVGYSLGLLLLSSALNVACIQEDNHLGSTLAPPIASEPLETPDVLAEGWNQVIMVANYAKTTLDTMAHYNTSRNACGKDAYGAIQASDYWNKMVQNINTAIKTPPRAEEVCLQTNQELDANGYYKKSMDGTTEIKLADGSKRSLFEAKGAEICTTIQDLAVATALLKDLNRLVALADKEDCPHGWGSALDTIHGR